MFFKVFPKFLKEGEKGIPRAVVKSSREFRHDTLLSPPVLSPPDVFLDRLLLGLVRL